MNNFFESVKFCELFYNNSVNMLKIWYPINRGGVRK